MLSFSHAIVLWRAKLTEDMSPHKITTDPLTNPTGLRSNTTNAAWIDATLYAFTTFNTPMDYIYFFLLLSLPITISAALQRRSAQEDEEDEEDVLRTICVNVWKHAVGFKKFFGLVEYWLRGDIQWGPWDAESVQNRWPDRTYMRRFCRSAIIPFRIERGGMQTYQKTYFRASGWDIKLPTYVQSKGRAYFEFLVLFPHGYETDPIPVRDKSRKKFLENLVRQKEYAVTISYWHLGKYHRRTDYSPLRPTMDPLEAGAESKLKILLPFKSDEILQSGKGAGRLPLGDFVPEYQDFTPLLATNPCAIIRVEALDYSPHRLDEFVFRMMREANVVDIWVEDDLARSLGKLLDRFGVVFDVSHEL